jgi:hypothetical protein
MHPNFLREEAARFRGMAETQEREASKQRLLKMAADYEAKADARGSELAASKSAEVTGGKGTAKEPDEAT